MRKIHIGLLGFGTVGSGVLEIIQRRETKWMQKYGFQPIIKKILVKNLDKVRGLNIEPELLTTHWEEIVHDPTIEVIIEVIGGEEPAFSIAKQTLTLGKHLITANKLMLALHGPTLFKLAQSQGIEIGFEGSVGGGIPIIQPLRESLNTNEIQSMMGIINGTTNYILTAMSEAQESYFDVLEKAQALGYAEADPSADVDGWDACYKLSVLTGVGFNTQLPVKSISTTGISQITLADIQIAKELGYVIKLIATVQRTNDGIYGHVHPTLLPHNHPLAHVHDVNNALLVKGDAVGEVLFYGPGAGKMATGSAVTSDLLRICRKLTNAQPKEHNSTTPIFTDPANSSKKNNFFLSIRTIEKPDIKKITSRLHEIPIQTIITNDDADLYTIGILTDQCTEKEITKTIENLSVDPQIRKIFYYYIEEARHAN